MIVIGSLVLAFVPSLQTPPIAITAEHLLHLKGELVDLHAASIVSDPHEAETLHRVLDVLTHVTAQTQELTTLSLLAGQLRCEADREVATGFVRRQAKWTQEAALSTQMILDRLIPMLKRPETVTVAGKVRTVLGGMENQLRAYGSQLGQ